MSAASPAAGAIEIRDAIRRGETTAVTVCRDALDRIAASDGRIHAFQSLMEDRAMARAEEIDREPTRFTDAALAGVPVAIKDNIATRGHATTAGSRMLEHFRPPYDAHVIERLDAAGAILVGKTTMDEFAMGSSTEHSAFGHTRNPWAIDRAPGGSSGGAAAAVAAGFVPLALGSDTGGSIRQPAAFCGVAGLKPTYGRVSRRGLIAFASSLDQIGPFARRVRDAAALVEVIAGADAGDATTIATPPIAWQPDTPLPSGIRLGVPRVNLDGVDEGVSAAFERALETLRAEGASVVDIDLPSSAHGVAAYYLIATAEASSNLARFDGVRYGARAAAGSLDEMYVRTRTEGFGREVKRRILLGTYALSAGYYDAHYSQALKVRTLIRAEFLRAFEGVDAILTPTTPTPAFALGERLQEPLQMYLADVFTVSANLAGLPAMSVPCGFSRVADVDLPIGLQIVGRPWDEAGVLTIGDAYERAAGWFTRAPAVPA